MLAHSTRVISKDRESKILVERPRRTLLGSERVMISGEKVPQRLRSPLLCRLGVHTIGLAWLVGLIGCGQLGDYPDRKLTDANGPDAPQNLDDGGSEEASATDGEADATIDRSLEGEDGTVADDAAAPDAGDNDVSNNPAEAGHVDPAEAGHVDPAEAGHVDPAEAGHVDPAEAGYGDPTEAGYVDRDNTMDVQDIDASAAPENLIPDGDFEAGIGQWENWLVQTYNVVSTSAHSGTYSLQGTGMLKDSALARNIKPFVLPGKRYQATGWVSVHNNTSGEVRWQTYRMCNGEAGNYPWLAAALVPDGTWKQLVGIVDLTDCTTIEALQLFAGTDSGDLYLDDVTLTPLP